MSAALPEHDRAAPDNVHRLNAVAPAPSRDAGGARPSGDEAAALRDQLVRLARHYAGDVSRLHRALERARTDEARARAERQQARRDADRLQRERDDLRQAVERERGEQARVRDRLEALEEAAELPWWAVMRRRAILRDGERSR